MRRARGRFWWPTANPRDGERGVTEAATQLRDLLREQCPDGVFWMDAAAHLVRVRLVPPAEVERYVEVATPHGTIRVAPLHEIESTDPRVTRVLRVLRETAAAPAGDTAAPAAVGRLG